MLKTNNRIQPCSQYTKEGALIARYPSITAAAAVSSTQVAHIGKVCMNKRNTAGGYAWKYNNKFTGKFKPKALGLTQSSKDGAILAVFRDTEVAALVTGLKESVITKAVASGRLTKGNRFVMNTTGINDTI